MPPEADAPQTLAAKLAEVVLEVNNVEKDGHNDFQNYDYTSAEALLGAIRKPLASRGVIVFPKLGEVSERGAVTPKGKNTTITTAHVTYVFVDAATGEREECPWAGTGDDPSDKGLYKAYTGAAKTFLRNAFLLPMGDDPEADTEADKRAQDGTKPSATHTNAQSLLADQVADLPGTVELVGPEAIKGIKELRAKVGLSAAALKAHVVATHSKDSLEALTLEEGQMVTLWLKQKEAKGAKAA